MGTSLLLELAKASYLAGLCTEVLAKSEKPEFTMREADIYMNEITHIASTSPKLMKMLLDSQIEAKLKRIINKMPGKA